MASIPSPGPAVKPRTLKRILNNMKVKSRDCVGDSNYSRHAVCVTLSTVCPDIHWTSTVIIKSETELRLHLVLEVNSRYIQISPYCLILFWWEKVGNVLFSSCQCGGY